MRRGGPPGERFVRLPSSSMSVDRKSDRNEKGERTKIFVGGLAETVTEYDLLKTCRRFGTVKGQDFLWHRSGPLMGKPRGFAFVEFSNESEALLALSALPGLVLHGKALSAHFMEPAPPDDPVPPLDASSASAPGFASREDLALEKEKSSSDDILATDASIRALQQRLSQLESSSPSSSSSPMSFGQSRSDQRQGYGGGRQGDQKGHQGHHQVHRGHGRGGYQRDHSNHGPQRSHGGGQGQGHGHGQGGERTGEGGQRFRAVNSNSMQEVFRKAKRDHLRSSRLPPPY